MYGALSMFLWNTLHFTTLPPVFWGPRQRGPCVKQAIETEQN